MARIPEFEQNALASSAAGTPGIDTSAAQIFGSASRALDRVTGQMAVELFNKKQQQDAIIRAQKTALDNAELAEHQFKLDAVIDSAREKLKQDNIAKPDQAVSQFQETGPGIIDSYIESSGVTDSVMQNRIKKAGNESLRASSGILVNWAPGQRTQNLVATFDSDLDEASRNMGNAASVEDLLAQNDKLRSYAQIQAGSIGPSAAEKFTKASTRGVQNFLSKLSRTDPQQAQDLIESGILDDLIDQKDLAPTYNAAQIDIKREEKKLEDEQKFAVNTGYIQRAGDLAEAAVRGELTAQELQVEQTRATAEKAPLSYQRTLSNLQKSIAVREQKVLKTEQKTQRKKQVGEVKEILGSAGRRFSDIKKRGRRGDKGVTAGDLSEVALDYLMALEEAKALNAISRTTFGAEKEKVLLELEAAVDASKKPNINNILGGLIGGKKAAKENAPDPQRILDVWPTVEFNYLRMVQRKQEEKGRDLTPTELDNLLKAVYQAALTRRR